MVDTVLLTGDDRVRAGRAPNIPENVLAAVEKALFAKAKALFDFDYPNQHFLPWQGIFPPVHLKTIAARSPFIKTVDDLSQFSYWQWGPVYGDALIQTMQQVLSGFPPVVLTTVREQRERDREARRSLMETRKALRDLFVQCISTVDSETYTASDGKTLKHCTPFKALPRRVCTAPQCTVISPLIASRTELLTITLNWEARQ